MKINKKISKRLKLSPRPPKSMLYVFIVVVYPIHGNFEKKIKFQKNFKKIKFLIFFENVIFCFPLPPVSMLDIISIPAHPLTNIDYGGRGFPIF